MSIGDDPIYGNQPELAGVQVGIEELIIERDVCQGHLRLSFYRLVRYHPSLRVRSRLWTKMATVARDITTDMAFTRGY